MSNKTSIEWTRGEDGEAGATWNPVRGCVKVSPGCKHCYAETFAERFRGVAGSAYKQGFDPLLVPDALDLPLRWRKPKTIFVNSMSDLFGEFVPEEYVAAAFGVMASASRHTFQVLTKRADRLPAWFRWLLSESRNVEGRGSPTAIRSVLAAHAIQHMREGHPPIEIPLPARWPDRWPLPNVWIGVSVEDRKFGLPRIEHLRQTPAAVRFLSIEPLLEDLGTIDLTGIHWVIVGGESGHRARDMDPDWVRSIRDQCVAAKVPFFFKQWGGIRKKVRGRLLDGRTWDEMPERKAL